MGEDGVGEIAPRNIDHQPDPPAPQSRQPVDFLARNGFVRKAGEIENPNST